MQHQFFQQQLEGMCAALKVPGAAVLLSKSGQEQTWFCGFSDVEKQLAPTSHTLFPVGSCSKSFIATAVCLLAEDQLLTLDSPVCSLLPDFQMSTAELTRDLTVRDMLSHTAGIATADLLWELRDGNFTCADLVSFLRFMPQVVPFRYQFRYQNHMFALASELVTRLSGMPWGEFVRTRILVPAGMTDTYCNLSDALTSGEPIARGYRAMPDGPVAMPDQDIYLAGGAAGSVTSTLNDMGRWLKLH